MTGGDILYVMANAVVENVETSGAWPVRLGHHGHGCLFQRWNHQSPQFHQGVIVIPALPDSPLHSLIVVLGDIRSR